MGDKIKELHEMHGTQPQEATKLLERKEVPNTPFVIIITDNNGEKKYQAALGNVFVGRQYDDISTCYDELKEKPWELLTNVMLTLINFTMQAQKNNSSL